MAFRLPSMLTQEQMHLGQEIEAHFLPRNQTHGPELLHQARAGNLPSARQALLGSTRITTPVDPVAGWTWSSRFGHTSHLHAQGSPGNSLPP